MKPFIMVSTRPELEAAQNEYESFLSQSGLRREDLHHVLLEEVDFLDAFTAGDVSGVLIGGSPYDVSTPEGSKTRSQMRVEEQVRELLAVALKKGVPVLATGFGLEVLAGYLGTPTSQEFGEELGAGALGVEGEDDAGAGGGGEVQVPGHVVEGAVRGLTGGGDERVVADGAHGFDRGGQSRGGTEGGVGGRRAGQGVDRGDAENAGQLVSSEGGCLRRTGGDDNKAGHSNAPLMREICCGSQGPLDQY